jgi:hypothetical protein
MNGEWPDVQPPGVLQRKGTEAVLAKPKVAALTSIERTASLAG